MNRVDKPFDPSRVAINPSVSVNKALVNLDSDALSYVARYHKISGFTPEKLDVLVGMVVSKLPKNKPITDEVIQKELANELLQTNPEYLCKNIHKMNISDQTFLQKLFTQILLKDPLNFNPLSYLDNFGITDKLYLDELPKVQLAHLVLLDLGRIGQRVLMEAYDIEDEGYETLVRTVLSKLPQNAPITDEMIRKELAVTLKKSDPESLCKRIQNLKITDQVFLQNLLIDLIIEGNYFNFNPLLYIEQFNISDPRLLHELVNRIAESDKVYLLPAAIDKFPMLLDKFKLDLKFLKELAFTLARANNRWELVKVIHLFHLDAKDKEELAIELSKLPHPNAVELLDRLGIQNPILIKSLRFRCLINELVGNATDGSVAKKITDVQRKEISQLIERELESMQDDRAAQREFLLSLYPDAQSIIDPLFEGKKISFNSVKGIAYILARASSFQVRGQKPSPEMLNDLKELCSTHNRLKPEIKELILTSMRDIYANYYARAFYNTLDNTGGRQIPNLLLCRLYQKGVNPKILKAFSDKLEGKNFKTGELITSLLTSLGNLVNSTVLNAQDIEFTLNNLLDQSLVLQPDKVSIAFNQISKRQDIPKTKLKELKDAILSFDPNKEYTVSDHLVRIEEIIKNANLTPAQKNILREQLFENPLELFAFDRILLQNNINSLDLCTKYNCQELLKEKSFNKMRLTKITELNQEAFATLGEETLQAMKMLESNPELRNTDAFLQFFVNVNKVIKDKPKLQPLQPLLSDFLSSVAVSKERFREMRYAPSKTEIHLSQVLSPEEQETWKKSLPTQHFTVQNNHYIAIDTDDPEEILLCGTEPQGSCLNIMEDRAELKCLLGYIWDPKIRLLAIKDSTGKIKARAIMRVLHNEEGKPVIFIDKIYPETHSAASKKALINLAKQKAAALNCPLYLADNPQYKEFGESESYLALTSKGNPAGIEYDDTNLEETKGDFTITNAILVQ